VYVLHCALSFFLVEGKFTEDFNACFTDYAKEVKREERVLQMWEEKAAKQK
jgi:hypothetical protein